MKFSQANYALIDGFFWTFLKMVASIHQAFIVNTMPNPKHMSDFMWDYSPRTIFDQIVIDFIRLFPKKSLVISCKWKYTCPLSNTCQSEYEIPLILRIEVSYTYSYQAKCIWRKWFFKYSKNISCIKLLFLSIRIYSLSYIF